MPTMTDSPNGQTQYEIPMALRREGREARGQKEHPILFSAPMILAILSGAKTQTRRIIKPQPTMFEHQPRHLYVWAGDRHIRCPYGPVGDMLWVRETCRAHELTDDEAREDTYGVIERLGLEYPPYGLDGVIYLADNTFREIENTQEAGDAWGKLNAYRSKRGATVPPIHMPRWASRIDLEVTEVRVERLQDIREEDAIAEGCRPDAGLHGDDDLAVHFTSDSFDRLNGRIQSVPMPVCRYAVLWESINGLGSWASNPWVWVVSFKRIKP